ncbi:MAG: GNAT family N-acetyltransferase [Candidatus Hydrogenedentes bacterium]|nr:GNAT family N-acetyltransferase [Candidatus Hydrogenedentota bacterium]
MSPDATPRSAPLDLCVRPASLAEIIDLRNEVIIQGTGRTSPEFPGDFDPSTVHMGAFVGDRNVGCATFLESSWEDEPAWQLRGMATAPDVRGGGIGARLLRESEAVLAQRSPIRLLWCNARKVAIPFYVKLDWKIETDEFLTPGIGMQRKMTKRY